MQGTRRPAHVFPRARARGPPLHPHPPPRAHPRRPFPAAQAARRKSTLRRATSRAGDARRRALLCVGAFLLLVPAGARPGYRCGQHANRYAFAALDEQGASTRGATDRQRRQRRAERHGLHRDLLDGHGAFAALDDQGAIHAWGHSDYGGSGAPSGTGFVAIFSTIWAFAALDDQGAIHAWGHSDYGGSGAPSGTGFTAIFSTK